MYKFKIFTTVFVLYEFIVITILQIPNFCVSLFNYNFCEMNGFKYLLFCLMLPTLFGLMFWWLPKQKAEPKTIKETLFDMIPPQYIRRFLIAAVIVGLRKFMMSHPRTKDFVRNINDILNKKAQ